MFISFSTFRKNPICCWLSANFIYWFRLITIKNCINKKRFNYKCLGNICSCGWFNRSCTCSYVCSFGCNYSIIKIAHRIRNLSSSPSIRFKL